MLLAGQTSQLALWNAVNHKSRDQHAFDEISHPLESFQAKCPCINICTGSANTMRRALFCSELALTDVSAPTLCLLYSLIPSSKCSVGWEQAYIRPLQLLLSDFIRFSCCSHIVPALASFPALSARSPGNKPIYVRFSCCSPLAAPALRLYIAVLQI